MESNENIDDDVTEANPLEDQIVKQLAAPIIEQHQRDKKFYARNRSATKRMNRPEKLAKMEKGAEFFMGILSRAKV